MELRLINESVKEDGRSTKGTRTVDPRMKRTPAKREVQTTVANASPLPYYCFSKLLSKC